MGKLLAILIGGVLVLAVMVLDPLGWSGWRAPEFEFGEPQLRAAVEGTWELEHDGTKRRFALGAGAASLERDDRAWDGMIRSAGACGERSFVRPAAACHATSMLALAGVSVSEGLEIRAGFHVLGYTFRAGYLDLHIADLRIGAQIRPDGSATRVESSDGKPATLRRVAARPATMSDPEFRQDSGMVRSPQ